MSEQPREDNLIERGVHLLSNVLQNGQTRLRIGVIVLHCEWPVGARVSSAELR